MKRALVIGRFQPVHSGHIQLIRNAMEHAGSVVVAVGSSENPASLRNPFSFEERKSMLEAAFGPGLEVVAVPDIHDPPRYAAHCVKLTGPIDEVFGNDERTIDLFEVEGFRVHRPGLKLRETWEGATIRAWIAEEDPQWKRAVPDAVRTILVDIEASKRLRTIQR